MNAAYLEIPTSSIPFFEAEHGRLRRQQRGIDKKDLQRAVKHGKRSPGRWKHNGCSTSQYIYKDIVYIVNNRTSEEVTSWASTLRLDLVPESFQMKRDHQRASERIQNKLDSWTSNTVLVVDTSGSMRESDMWGTRNRLDAVWVSIALDFLAQRLESGNAGSTDVVSVVTFGDTTKCLIQEEPCTWILYNKIVSIYNNVRVQPRGHGPFLPSLEMVDTLLTRNSNASCAMGLTFLSDGVPSDHAVHCDGHSVDACRDLITKSIGDLARQFGRRLTFMAIGIGDCDDFNVLQQMVDAALDFGSIAELRVPSMTSSSLGHVFSSIATSITSTQLEMTDLEGKTQQKVRDVRRESRKKASEVITTVSAEDFHIYRSNQVRRTVYTEQVVGSVTRKSYETVPLQHPDAKYVALGKGPFGEGAERFAYRFYELAEDGRTIVGKALVAKESRLVIDENLNDEKLRKEFVRTFCSTQQLAGRLAEKFNVKLGGTNRADDKTPVVTFLDCSIYQLDDVSAGRLSVLVEEKLDHNKWFKWNANNGFVEGMKSALNFSEDSIRAAMIDLTKISLDMIDEGSEDEDEDDSEPETRPEQILFTASEVAQAFSHFSYATSGRKRLVCDLQGVYDEEKRVLMLSDPVIHYYNQHSERRNVHGRTDRGQKGIAMFFETHHEHCGHLCKLMNRGFRKRRHFHQTSSTK